MRAFIGCCGVACAPARVTRGSCAHRPDTPIRIWPAKLFETAASICDIPTHSESFGPHIDARSLAFWQPHVRLPIPYPCPLLDSTCPSPQTSPDLPCVRMLRHVV